jgi:thioredoxin-dependent peroxiredoxin
VALKKAGIEVIGVSTDPAATLQRFREERGLPYALVSDAGGSITRAYRARWPIIGLARRVTYLIGRDRKIRLAFRSERDFTAHPERVLREAARA